jgi:hypothetical protein
LAIQGVDERIEALEKTLEKTAKLFLAQNALADK